MNVSNVEVLLFDLGKVLLDFDHSLIPFKLAKYSEDSPDEMFRLFFESKLNVEFEEGKITPEEFFSQMKTTFGLKRLTFKEFLKIWTEIFWEKPEMNEFIRILKEKYRIFIISNVDKSHFDYVLKKFPIVKEAEKLILSYKVGVCKPHPLIYERALKLSGVPKERAVYIDDQEKFVEAAKELGLVSIQFKNIAQLKKDLNSLGVECF